MTLYFIGVFAGAVCAYAIGHGDGWWSGFERRDEIARRNRNDISR